MQVNHSDRGFEFLDHEVYLGVKAPERVMRLASQSSAIDFDYEGNGLPGSSYLWIAENHHLNREEVKRFICHLQNWVDTGSMKLGE